MIKTREVYQNPDKVLEERKMPQLNTDPLEFETDEYNKEIADAKARYLRVHGPVG